MPASCDLAPTEPLTDYAEVSIRGSLTASRRPKPLRPVAASESVVAIRKRVYRFVAVGEAANAGHKERR